MKLAAVLALAAFPSSLAFVVKTPSSSSPSALYNSRVDTSELIKKAMEATKKYGAASPEARLLWEDVEEMDASDNSAATKGALDSECEIEEDASISDACADYDDKMQELSSLVAEYGPKLDKLKALTQDLSGMKLSGTKIKEGDSPALKAAIAEATAAAEAATAEFGASSPEAMLAWETVEEVASSGLGNAMGAGLDIECVIDSASDACQALDELNKALKLD